MSELLSVICIVHTFSTLFYRETRYFPIAGLSDTGPYTFELPAQASMLTDTNSIELHGSVQILYYDDEGKVKELGATDLDNVIPVNMLPSAMFNSVEVMANGVVVTYISSPIANYKAYLETLLSYNELAMKGHLVAQRFLIDDVGAASNDGTNLGANQTIRKDWFAKSNKVDFVIPLASDILRVDKYLIDRLGLTIKLSRTNDEFLFCCKKTDTKKYFVKITELFLTCRHIAVKPSFIEHMNKVLDGGKRAVYPLLRTVLKSRTIGKDEWQCNVTDLYSGRLPSQIIFGLVENSAFRGHRQLNPFNFKHYNVTSLILMVNSKQFPSVRFQPKFRASVNESKIMREFAALMSGIGVNGNEAPLVTLDHFHDGSTLWAFDLSPDACTSYHNHKVCTYIHT